MLVLLIVAVEIVDKPKVGAAQTKGSTGMGAWWWGRCGAESSIEGHIEWSVASQEIAKDEHEKKYD